MATEADQVLAATLEPYKKLKYILPPFVESLLTGVSTASEVLDRGYGKCSDFVVVYGALLRYKQITFNLVIGCPKNKNTIFTHIWTVVNINGREFEIDPTSGGYASDMQPICVVDWEDNLTSGSERANYEA